MHQSITFCTSTAFAHVESSFAKNHKSLQTTVCVCNELCYIIVWFFLEHNQHVSKYTLQEIKISHLGKRKIIFKYALSGGYVNSLEGKLFDVFFGPQKEIQSNCPLSHGGRGTSCLAVILTRFLGSRVFLAVFLWFGFGITIDNSPLPKKKFNSWPLKVTESQ